jgi:predicted RNase H-like HicB family nuclease
MKKKISGVVWKEGKYFVAQGLNVDVSSFGNTKNEALRNLDEAIELYGTFRSIVRQSRLSASDFK